MTEINIRRATVNDIDRISEIQQSALAVLKNPEELDPVPVEDLLNEIKNALMAVALVDGKIAAFRTMHIPEEDYLGPYIGIKDPNREGLIYSDITIVDPEFRGMSLQRKLGQWLFDDVEKKYKVIMATVHPNNLPSLKDKFHLGMSIVAMDYLYGGKLRFVFMKDLKQDAVFHTHQKVHHLDIEKISMLLEAGDIGYQLCGEEIYFGKNVNTAKE
ncbi:GNAT family N-acetyltransferase [Macrococcoides caseolyticum]|uniref:GNAT family N-acetyltransferase n=1 Tax=Macrococcoides caseolyticum TaxID=69966 RepID=UPI001F1FE776|nr:hypothetical protein [Macrococcus caseolyticus]MCE4957538.1 hypothetical protein [Macrococcus caseolyticus]